MRKRRQRKLKLEEGSTYQMAPRLLLPSGTRTCFSLAAIALVSSVVPSVQQSSQYWAGVNGTGGLFQRKSRRKWERDQFETTTLGQSAAQRETSEPRGPSESAVEVGEVGVFGEVGSSLIVFWVVIVVIQTRSFGPPRLEDVTRLHLPHLLLSPEQTYFTPIQFNSIRLNSIPIQTINWANLQIHRHTYDIPKPNDFSFRRNSKPF